MVDTVAAYVRDKSGVLYRIGGSGGLTEADADDRYVNIDGDIMTGPLEVPDVKVTAEFQIASHTPESGLVWTAEDTLGFGSWQEPSSLVVAETSDPVLINWFDNTNEGWIQYAGAGSMAWLEMNSPSMPGVLHCQGDVWAEWQAGAPLVFESEALYRITVRARLDATATLSFGLQMYDAATPPVLVDNINGSTNLLPHWCAFELLPGDGAWVDDVIDPGEWLAWTGYLSGRTTDVAANLPASNAVTPSDPAVQVAANAKMWRAVLHATGGQVWVDAIEIHRLDRSLELPGGIKTSDIYADSVNTTDLHTENFAMPPAVPGYVLTAVDTAGDAEWQYPPIQVLDDVPVDPPENPLTVTLVPGTQRHSDSVICLSVSTTITATTWTRIPGSDAFQWTQEVPAIVTVRMQGYGSQTGGSNGILLLGVGVEDENAVVLAADDYESAAAVVAWSGRMKLVSSGGEMMLTTHWRGLLPIGTYLVYPRAYVSPLDAAMAKKLNYITFTIDIDPEATYMPGHV